ncbi:zinc dependent phospholipase C family protein [Halobacillus campisalis]|uniref:Zinc dependent phospholipase C family protein n=1 Tax=Halobacillus campisalis TaxID=435909 RepID=A0ABW2K1Q1_9BACI|nr:zinc dependent phospholipase C family protein [Halobacillus campisalis]
MPNIWTHILFAEDLCMKLEREDLLATSERSLYLGAQGPDPFFYYNFWPKASDHGVPEAGMQLHTMNCGDFLIEMIERGKSRKHNSQAYILGFVSHHMLDRITHPYIHYKSGYEGNKHQALEVAIDTIMMEKHRRVITWLTPVHPYINLSDQTVEEIESWLKACIENHYDLDVPSSFIKKSFKDIVRAQRVLFDPYGYKNKLLGSAVSSFSHRPIVDDKDYLNMEQLMWRHSATNEVRRASFEQLYAQALEEACALYKEILLYWSEDSDARIETIKSMVQNISYDTGLPISLKAVNKYASPIV